MSKITTTDFYPNNPVTSAAAVNANYASFLGSNTINSENVRVEGIDTRNVSGPSMVQYIGAADNGYNLTFPSPVSAGATYPFYTSTGGGKGPNIAEFPINHDSTGATNTNPGFGTKLPIGTVLKQGDIIRCRWWVNVFVNGVTDNFSVAADHSSQLIYIGARPQGGANGSGVGEWCALVYPKYNLTSNALLDANFVDVGAVSGLVAVDPPNETPGIGGAVKCSGGAFDHVSMIPHFIMTAGNAIGAYAVGTYQGYMADTAYQGEHILKVPAGVAGQTLYGAQLFFSGAWRMTSDLAPDANAALFLEDQVCDNAIASYGVSGMIGLERAYIQITIYRNTEV